MWLCLFDVDGTLISTKGAGRRAMGRTLLDVYGVTGPLDSYDMSGKTDPRIIFDLMRAAAIPDLVVTERLERFYACYAEALKAEIEAGDGVEPLPGVRELVRRLAERPTAIVGLLTGNIEAAARLKLAPTGLLPYFKVGAYGSDDADRARLPRVAASRAEALVGHPVSPGHVVVIGDTPLDIECARAFGARAVVVATGRHRAEDLALHRPDALFADLTDMPRVLSALFDGGP